VLFARSGACLHQAGDAIREVVPLDDLGIDVKLAEDDLRDGALHGATAAPVEALWVGEEIEGGHEELAAGVELAGRIGQLALNLGALPFDHRELGLQLLTWP